MKITGVIATLERMKETYGDVEVIVVKPGMGMEPLSEFDVLYKHNPKATTILIS